MSRSLSITRRRTKTSSTRGAKMAPIGREISPGHRLVPASMLPDQINNCPHCGSKSFSLTGYFKRFYEQPFENSAPIKETLTMGSEALQEIQGINCKACGIHTLIEDDLVFERENLIFDLHTEIATLQGKIPTPSGKEWKN